MISEQSAIQTPTRALPAPPFDNVRDFDDGNGARSDERPKWRRVFIDKARAAMRALIGTVASLGNPSFFAHERRGPTLKRLGPGLSRESDAFWPLSEW
jgi:hypothetical protein